MIFPRHASDQIRRSARLTVAALTALAVVAWALPAASQPPRQLMPEARLHAGEMVVPVNKSQVLKLDRAYAGLSVGNPEIADVVALSNKSVYVLGKAMGTTNLSVYGPGRELIAVVDVVVTHDVDGLKTRLHELIPGAPIEVRAVNDSVVLSGIVDNPEQANRAVSVAQRFAPDKVTNLLRVRGSQQVMLSVRVAEVSRTVAKELGFKPNFQIGDAFTFSTLDPLDLTRFGAALIETTSEGFNLDFLIDALEEKGLVKVLAEPNLVAMSGDTANFLAGGEFPIPVAQENNGGNMAITIEFKEFGVSLAFTPTVIDGDLINLVVNPEVSQIDNTTSVTLSGFRIPGLSTRRATTTVELRDGQSFMIAGLLQSDFSDTVRQIPGLGNVPVLGALFRSSEYERRETELVIMVTPHLVQPVDRTALRLPTDGFVPPSDMDIFFWGRIEGDRAPIMPGQTAAAHTASANAEAGAVLGSQAKGGLAGSYGHIIK